MLEVPQTTLTEGAGETLTRHRGIQWNSMVMRVKKATFQRMGSGGKDRTENTWDVSDAGQSAPR
jgi:hypothetical protein